ncbi:MAG: hypothetical protein ACR2MX_11085 [Cyclobacteriaceae bacterium]
MNLSEQTNKEEEQPIEPKERDLPDPTTLVFYNPVIQKMIQRRKEIARELRSSFISCDDIQVVKNHK